MKNLRNESAAADFLGKAFVPCPRNVLNLLFCLDKHEQSAGILYTALLSKVFFVEGYTRVKKRVFNCSPGEYIATHRELATYSGMCLRTYFNALRWLIDKSLVGTTTLPGATRFYLYGFTEFGKLQKMTVTNPPAASSVSLAEAERRIGGRSMQFEHVKGQESGKEQA